MKAISSKQINLKTDYNHTILKNAIIFSKELNLLIGKIIFYVLKDSEK